MTTHPNHQSQINAGIEKSLIDAGIPATFVRQNLSTIQEGAAISEIVMAATAAKGCVRATGAVFRLDAIRAKAGGLKSFHLTARA